MSTVTGAATRIFEVEGGFPGFPSLSELTISAVDDHALFAWLQSPGDDGVAFLAVNPFVYFPAYDVDLGDADQAALRMEPGDELIVYCLVTMDRRHRRASANLVAPVVINVTRGRMRQVILEGEHRLRAPLPVPPGPQETCS